MLPADFECVVVPDDVLDYPSMITTAEKTLLYWLASDYYRGDGLIIDAGVFLGGSTNAFVTGISSNQKLALKFEKPVRSFDIAIWVDSMNRYLEFPNVQRAFDGLAIAQGDSFEPVLRRLLSSQLPLVDLVVGDIIKTAFSEHPVEIAFYDCLKTNDRDLAVFRAFAPHYIPGRTIVLQQDYFYESAAYNKIRQEYFSDYFEFLGQVSTTAVFRNTKEIPKSEFETDFVSELTIDEKIKFLGRAAKRAENNKTRILTELSIVELLIDEGHSLLAQSHLDDIENEISLMSLDEITRRPQNIAAGFKRRLRDQRDANSNSKQTI